jgi:hypothetical protein
MTITEQQVELDEVKLQAFVGQAVSELGATLGAARVVIGDRLGLYNALAGAGPLSRPCVLRCLDADLYTDITGAGGGGGTRCLRVSLPSSDGAIIEEIPGIAFVGWAGCWPASCFCRTLRRG